jgi:hypothetical protein
MHVPIGVAGGDQLGQLAGVRDLPGVPSDADKAVAAEHATARSGVALLSAPGVPLRRFRAPHTTYAQYYDEVAAAVTNGKPSAAA